MVQGLLLLESISILNYQVSIQLFTSLVFIFIVHRILDLLSPQQVEDSFAYFSRIIEPQLFESVVDCSIHFPLPDSCLLNEQVMFSSNFPCAIFFLSFMYKAQTQELHDQKEHFISIWLVTDFYTFPQKKKKTIMQFDNRCDYIFAVSKHVLQKGSCLHLDK